MNKGRDMDSATIKEYEETWLPLLKTNGKFDAEKIKNEFTDLIFVFNQVSKVYMALTGCNLSKPNYYANTIIDFHKEEISKAYHDGYTDGYEEGYEDCLDEEDCFDDVVDAALRST